WKHHWQAGKRQGTCTDYQQSVPNHQPAQVIGSGNYRAKRSTEKLKEEQKAGDIVAESPPFRQHWQQNSQHDDSRARQAKARAKNEIRYRPPVWQRLQSSTTSIHRTSAAARAPGL